MDNREIRRRNRKRTIIRRRIFGIVILLFFIAIIGIIISGLINSTEAKENTQSEPTVISEEEKLLNEIISKDPIEEFRSKLVSTEDTNLYYEKVLPFRQRRIRDHAMGRITSQKNLKKQVYLTFDDGPSSEVTDQILDILKNYNIKATFFVIGQNAQYYPEILKRIHEEGHSIGIHTYDHNYKKIYSSPDNLQQDIENCLQEIRDILGEDFNTNLYRFPGGSYRKNKEIFINRIEEMGLIYYDWNALNGDAEGKNPSESYLINRFNETSNGYNVILSLMHDTNAKTNTVNSLPEIIERLQSEGYEFKKLGAN